MCSRVHVTQFEGWRYRVLRSGHSAFQTDDGSYLDKLALDDVSVGHGGVYICVATNTAGYSYREAVVHVISGRLYILQIKQVSTYLRVC